MDTPFAFDPNAITAEINGMMEKIKDGYANFAELSDYDYGCTEKTSVYEEGKLKLYRFESSHKKAKLPPLLIVYALVNRPYMVDLQENRSIVRSLLEAGHDVYIIDWGYPDRSDRFFTLDDYINGMIDRCVDVVCQRTGFDRINLLGICQGGVFSLCYASAHQEKINKLLTMVTPVDFHAGNNLLSHWHQSLDVDLLVDTLGNIPADMMNACYLMLKPYRLSSQKYVGLIDMMGNPEQLQNFMRMERWIFDSPDLVGEAFRQFVKDCYQGNKLVKGTLTIGDHIVDLTSLSIPVLNIYAQQDHLVPPEASTALAKLVPKKHYSELSFKGGHIGIYVSGRAQREVPPAIDKWLKQ